jgi:hypothetical protein
MIIKEIYDLIREHGFIAANHGSCMRSYFHGKTGESDIIACKENILHIGLHRCRNVTSFIYDIKNEFRTSYIVREDGPRFYNTVRPPRKSPAQIGQSWSRTHRMLQMVATFPSAGKTRLHPTREEESQFARDATHLICSRKVPGSDFNTRYTDRGFAWLSSVSLGKW